MSRIKFIVVSLCIAASSAGAAVWLWRRWCDARKGYELDLKILNMLAPDPATICTLIGMNKTDAPIDALELEYSGKARLLNATTGASTSSTQFSMKSLAEGGRARIPVDLRPGERRWCAKLVGDGQLEKITAVVGETSSLHAMSEKFTAGGTLVLIFEPDGKVSVSRE